MHKVLVTGATGFVGKNLVHELVENGVNVIAVVRTNSELPANWSIGTEEIVIVQCDLNHIKELPRLLRDINADKNIDCCIHLAWEGTTGQARADNIVQLKNISRTLELCSILPELNIKRFVGIGTLAEKDANFYIPTDGATPNTVSYYGVAKLTAHYMSKIECTKLGVEHIWCQLSNLYGPEDRTNNFVNFASKIMLDHKRPSFTTGEQTYDFVYITDVVRGIYKAAKLGKVNTMYYIGSGESRKLKFFIHEIRDVIDPNIDLYLGEVPFNGVCLPNDVFDCSKLMNDTGYKALVSFKDGIKNTIEWLKIEYGED